MFAYLHVILTGEWEEDWAGDLCKNYEVMSGNCGRNKEYISRSYRRVRYRLVGYGSSALIYLTIRHEQVEKTSDLYPS